MMSKIEDGGPAFPSTHESMDPRNPGWVGGGLTMRDYFAAKAMQEGLHDWLAKAGKLTSDQQKSELMHIPEMAYGIADAMLKARQS